MEINEQELIQNRRYLHAHPEVGFQEFETTKFLISQLSKHPELEIHPLEPTGVVAFLKGKYPGKVLALRSDIDALAMDEEIEEEYHSCNPGAAHTCGHDTHMAMLLETIRILCTKQDEIHGTVKFIFQPCEETPPGGAIRVIATHLLDDVNAFVGLHIFTGSKTGEIQIVNDRYATSASARFLVKVSGKGGHGGIPNNSIDPITAAASMVTSMQSIIAREIAPSHYGVISVCQFHSGSGFNIIPDTATFNGTIRAASNEVMPVLQKRIREMVEGIAAAYRVKTDLTFFPGYRSIENDPELVKFANEVIEKELGKEYLKAIPMNPVSEDFSMYQSIAPSVFLQLGGGDCPYMNHHPKFTIDEKALAYGVRAEVALALAYLK